MRTPPPDIAERLWAVGDRVLEPGTDLRIDDLSELTGIARATLYYYFSGKNDVVEFLLAQQLQQGTEAVAAAVQQPGSPAERLAAVIRALLDMMAEHPALCTRLLGWIANAGTTGQVMTEVERTMMRPVRTLLADAQTSKQLIVVDPMDATLSILGAISMVAMVHTGNDSFDPTTVADRLVPQLLDGLRPR